MTGAEIHRALEREIEDKSRVPSVRSVQNIMREFEFDDSGDWDVSQDDPEVSLPTVLETLVWMIEWSKGRRTSLTRGEAKWLTRIERASPGMPPLLRLTFARAYIERTARSQSSEDLDTALAYEAWKDEAHWKDYLRVLDRGWVQLPPPYLLQRVLYAAQEEMGGLDEHDAMLLISNPDRFLSHDPEWWTRPPETEGSTQ